MTTSSKGINPVQHSERKSAAKKELKQSKKPAPGENGGKCTKCKCQGWKPGTGKPKKCVNVRVPTRNLCDHLKADHKAPPIS